MAISRLDWHFTDYPKDNEQVLVKTTENELVIAEWDVDKRRWLDVGRDRSWFGGGVACWAYIIGVPDTTKEMAR